jgi:site-specific DNA-methyltransferase (adenine-specific)
MLNTGSYNPDILTCLANLSSDEVFTPPKVANEVLDQLPPEIWKDKKARFLDPFCKSGVFPREIARRLMAGLEKEIPNRQKRVNHIFTKQIFAIAITELTAHIARRSAYCSKTANGKYSVCDAFDDNQGNIRFKRTKHTWEDNRCVFCGASKQEYDRGDELETHAYQFIHTEKPEEIFNMKFDVIVGNPPYQLAGGAGGSSDSSIYQLFVEQALKLNPRFLSMVIPSRWLAGGRGMDEFRKTMLTGKHMSHLVDYTQMSTAFPGVDFEGGVGYFLWDRSHQGGCEYTLVLGDKKQPPVVRKLDEFDVFVRDTRAVSILKKVQHLHEPSMIDLVSGDTPFGLATNFSGYKEKSFRGSVALFLTERGKRIVVHTARTNIRKNTHLIDSWKVLLPEAYGERGAIPALVLGPSIVARPESVCTQTYLVAGPLASRKAANSLQGYTKTRFFRFLVSLRKITQHALRSTYSWVPQQTWDRTWTDNVLYKKYGLSKDDITFIESQIRPVEAGDE